MPWEEQVKTIEEEFTLTLTLTLTLTNQVPWEEQVKTIEEEFWAKVGGKEGAAEEEDTAE